VVVEVLFPEEEEEAEEEKVLCLWKNMAYVLGLF
jgi:hypothetical protein